MVKPGHKPRVGAGAVWGWVGTLASPWWDHERVIGTYNLFLGWVRTLASPWWGSYSALSTWWNLLVEFRTLVFTSML